MPQKREAKVLKLFIMLQSMSSHSHAYCRLWSPQHSTVEMLACLLMPLLSSVAVSWRRCLRLFLPPLAPSLTSWVMTLGDAPLMLLRTG
jgi:hypothetical protein